jgi:DNA polymerase IV
MEEAFIDVGPTGAHGPDVARRIRREVRERTGLAITVGVARSKILAKMASRAAKPDGLLVVPAEEEAAFLHPMRVEELWGVGAATARRLQARGMTTIGDVAAQPVAVVVAALGDAAGRRLHEIATNRDRRPVVADRPRRSFGAQRAGRRSSSSEELDEVLRGLVDRLCGRMHRAGRAGRTVVLRLRFGDFTRATRAHTLPALTAEPEELLGAARLLMDAALPMAARRGLTLVGLTITNLDGDDGPGEQLELELALGGRAPPGEDQRTPTRSTTKTSVSSGPITPPAPRLP